MKKLMTGVLLVALLAVGGVVSAGLTSGEKVTAHEAEEEHTHDDQEEQANTDEEQPQEEGAAYNYVAQPGDSYTLMARKAVQTYGLKHDVQLSPAGILYAETNMVQEAGSPLLEVGQNVGIAEAAVQQWVERAQELTDEQESDWNYYVQFADFNTDNVGEQS